MLCQNHISQLGKNAQLLSGDGYIGVCEGVWGGGGIFWLLNENQTFKCPDA